MVNANIKLYGPEIAEWGLTDRHTLVAIVDPVNYRQTRGSAYIPGLQDGEGIGEVLRLQEGWMTQFLMKDRANPPTGLEYEVTSSYQYLLTDSFILRSVEEHMSERHRENFEGFKIGDEVLSSDSGTMRKFAMRILQQLLRYCSAGSFKKSLPDLIRDNTLYTPIKQVVPHVKEGYAELLLTRPSTPVLHHSIQGLRQIQ